VQESIRALTAQAEQQAKMLNAIMQQLSKISSSPVAFDEPERHEQATPSQTPRQVSGTTVSQRAVASVDRPHTENRGNPPDDVVEIGTYLVPR